MNLFDQPGIVRPAKNLAELAVEIKTSHYAGEADLKRGIEKYSKAGELLLAAKEQAGHGNFETWVTTNLPFSYRTARRYMALSKTGHVASLLEAITPEVDAEDETQPERVHSESPPAASTPSSAPSKPTPSRSGLWETASKETLAKLPGGDKLSPVAKLPDLLLNHLKNFTNTLSDFSRCYDLPADADRLGERLKAVRDWATEHVPKATLKPRKPSYKKRCQKCMYEIQMTMKEDYGWAPLDMPSDEYAHWEVVDDIAYFRKTAAKGFRTDHRRTCPKAEHNKPIPE